MSDPPSLIRMYIKQCSDPDPDPQVLYVFGPQDPDPDPLVRGTDLDPAPDYSLF